MPLPARRHVDAVAAAVRLPRAPADLADRDRARLPVPLLVLLDLAAARALGARAVDRLGLPRTSPAAAITSSSPTICSGITRRAAWRWPRSCAAAASASSGSWCRAASIWWRGTPTLLEAWRPIARDFDIFFGLEAATNEGLTGLVKDATVDQTAAGHRRRASLGYGVTGNFVIDPAWREADFERLWAFVERHQLFQAGFTILTPLPGHRLLRGDAPAAAGAAWSQFDMHHLLWEPALGPERFFELYCETWRRSVLNLRGRKSLWHWLREVDLRNALFLLRALRRTQRMMDPAHYLAEYDLGGGGIARPASRAQAARRERPSAARPVSYFGAEQRPGRAAGSASRR